MAEHMPAGPVETGAEMDYAEHQKTYALFLTVVKWGLLSTAAILISMAFAFFTTAGFFSAAVLFILIIVIGSFLLR
jgi:Ca2+-dependent lipid-binding protein